MATQIEGQLADMSRMQQLRGLKAVNEMADRCFDACINDFAMTRQLRSSETECLDKCVQKYLDLSLRSGQGFAQAYGKPLN